MGVSLVVVVLHANRKSFSPSELHLWTRCFSKIQIGFTFLVPAHPCCPRQRAVKQFVCVRVRVCVMLFDVHI